MTEREKEVIRAIARALREPDDKKVTDAADAFVMLYLPSLISVGRAYIRREALAMLLDRMITQGGIDG